MKTAPPALVKKYVEIHWGESPTKLIHVADQLCPDVVAFGELNELKLPQGVLVLPRGAWLAFDPKHPAERLHIITPPAFREQIRQMMKHASPMVPIQQIAEAAGGDHVRYPLPNIQGTPLGICTHVVYRTHKRGDPPSQYDHKFGEEWSKGIRPALAADCSGRLWLCGGSYRCPAAGISG